MSREIAVPALQVAELVERDPLVDVQPSLCTKGINSGRSGRTMCTRMPSHQACSPKRPAAKEYRGLCPHQLVHMLVLFH